jgi:hypothetical protein
MQKSSPQSVLEWGDTIVVNDPEEMKALKEIAAEVEQRRRKDFPS